MDVVMVNRLIARIGFAHAELCADGVVTHDAFKSSIVDCDNEYLIQKPEEGVELWFRSKDAALEKVLFSLISMVDGARPYSGELPLSMTASMSRITVRKILGAPCESKEPVKILRYRGYGGSDIYRMDDFGYPGVHVGFQYRNDDMVCSMAFYLGNVHRN